MASSRKYSRSRHRRQTCENYEFDCFDQPLSNRLGQDGGWVGKHPMAELLPSAYARTMSLKRLSIIKCRRISPPD
jgi:hypothetical protein